MRRNSETWFSMDVQNAAEKRRWSKSGFQNDAQDFTGPDNLFEVLATVGIRANPNSFCPEASDSIILTDVDGRDSGGSVKTGATVKRAFDLLLAFLLLGCGTPGGKPVVFGL